MKVLIPTPPTSYTKARQVNASGATLREADDIQIVQALSGG